MKSKTPTIFKIWIATSTAVCAAGILILLFTSLSNAAAAAANGSSVIHLPTDTSAERWRIFTDMQKNRGDPGVVAYNQKIYVMGGYFPSFNGYNQTQEVYDPQTDSWQFVANLPVERSDMMVSNVGDMIYAIGGWNDDLGGPITYTQMYDPLSNQWFTMTSMITPVSGAGVVVLTDTIYILGGAGRSNPLGAVQKYDPISDTWSLGTPMSVPRSELGAVLLNGKIYTIGGVTNGGVTTNTVEIYYPVTDTWKLGPPLPEGRASMAVGVRLGKIYVVGGVDQWPSGNPQNSTFVFDPGTNSWSTVNPMPTARSACRAAVVNDIIYVIGGKGDPGAGSANEGFGFPPITPTTTINSDNPDPSQVNQPFTVTYAVTASGVIPTGVVTVTVANHPEMCSGTLTNGLGSCALALNTLGTHTLTATYSGNYILLSSSVTETHTVVRADTLTMITADDPDPSLVGQPITVTFAVTSPFGLPTGSVIVTTNNNLESCSGALTNAKGKCSLTLDAAGSYTLTASYSGDANFNPSSNMQPHTVNKVNTTTIISSDLPDPSVVNQPFNITYTVVASLSGVPTGTVTVTISGRSEECSGLLVNGVGGCSLNIPSAGTFTLTAEYPGNAIFISSSDTETHEVELHKLFLPIAVRK